MNMRGSVSRRQILRAAGAVGVLGALGVPGTALAADDRNEQRVYIGFSLHPAGPTTNVGSFAMSGRFEDSGVSTAQASISPINSKQSRLSGEQQFAGQKGTIFTRFEGVSFPNNDPHAVGKGRFTIVSGTGAYAGVEGQGSFLIVVDFTSNQLIGTEVGTVEN